MQLHDVNPELLTEQDQIHIEVILEDKRYRASFCPILFFDWCYINELTLDGRYWFDKSFTIHLRELDYIYRKEQHPVLKDALNHLYPMIKPYIAHIQQI
jgi:hypothetical protein